MALNILINTTSLILTVFLMPSVSNQIKYFRAFQHRKAVDFLLGSRADSELPAINDLPWKPSDESKRFVSSIYVYCSFEITVFEIKMVRDRMILKLVFCGPLLLGKML